MQRLTSPYTDLPYYPGISFSPQLYTGSISYPPLSAFMFALTYRAYLIIGAPSRFVYYFLLKQPIVISDVLTAVVLARIILISHDPSCARLGFLIWIYLPLSIIASSVWGGLDPIALLFILLAVFSLLTSRETVSALFLGLAIFLKAMPIVALPVFVMAIGTGSDRRLRYFLTSLAIPAVGTLAPIFLLNWGFGGLFSNLIFQADIPSVGEAFGEMSFPGRLLYTLGSSGPVNSIVGLVWVPILLLSYAYIGRRRPPLLQGILVAILAFSIARPFLSEQWALYPLALILGTASRKNSGHFFGISITATAYLVINYMLLLRFLVPISTGFASVNVYGDSPFAQSVITYTLLILAGLFFGEALMTIIEAESILYRMLREASHLMRILIPEPLLVRWRRRSEPRHRQNARFGLPSLDRRSDYTPGLPGGSPGSVKISSCHLPPSQTILFCNYFFLLTIIATPLEVCFSRATSFMKHIVRCGSSWS